MEAEFAPRRDDWQIMLKMMIDKVANAVKDAIFCTHLKRKSCKSKVHMRWDPEVPR